MTIRSARSEAARLMDDPNPAGIIYRRIRRAAENGLPCPSNRDLADAIGARSAATPQHFLERMRMGGVLAIESNRHKRRVTIRATGASTWVEPGFEPVDRADLRERTAQYSLHRRAELGPAIDDRKQREEHETAMSSASARLAAAMKEQMQLATVVEQRRRDARKLSATALDFIPLDKPAPVAAAPRRAADRRPPAPGRDPCPRCATRGDLGCEHFAPCEGASR